MLNKKYFFIIIVVIAGCKTEDKSDLLKSGKEFKISDNIIKDNEIQTIPFIEVTNLSTIQLKGKSINNPQDNYQVTFPFQGTIRKIYKNNGAKVTKGSLLAEIDNPYYLDIKSEYLSKKNELDYLKQNFQRQGELAMEQATSLKKLEEAQNNYQTIEVQVKMLEEKIKLLGISPDKINLENLNSIAYILSPATGTIINENCTLGGYFSEKDILFSISISNKINFIFDLQTPSLFDLRENNLITLSPETDKSISFSGHSKLGNDSLVIIEIGHSNNISLTEEQVVWSKFNLKPEYIAIPESWVIEGNYLIVKTDRQKYRAIKLTILTALQKRLIVSINELNKKEEIVCKNSQRLIDLTQ